jgi:hypothetical protein
MGMRLFASQRFIHIERIPMKFARFSLAAAIAATLIGSPVFSANAGTAQTPNAGVVASSASAKDLLDRKVRSCDCGSATDSGQPGDVVEGCGCPK